MSRTNYGAKLCIGHTQGFSPTQARKYNPDCRMCERDRAPAGPQFVFTNRRRSLRMTTKRKEQRP